MKKLYLILFLCCSSITFAQELKTGDVIPEFGKTYAIESPEFKTDTTSKLKVVFDVNRSFDEAEPNKLIETAARYLNMHEQAGVPVENMEVAVILHGKAVQDALQDEYYTDKFPKQSANPNLPLIKSLTAHGVQVIICGQSATHYGVTRENSDTHTKFALSAMTALVQLQNEHYRLIKF